VTSKISTPTTTVEKTGISTPSLPRFDENAVTLAILCGVAILFLISVTIAIVYFAKKRKGEKMQARDSQVTIPNVSLTPYQSIYRPNRPFMEPNPNIPPNSLFRLDSPFQEQEPWQPRSFSSDIVNEHEHVVDYGNAFTGVIEQQYYLDPVTNTYYVVANPN
jgi:hypothetical protein